MVVPRYTFCRICEALCGLTAEVAGGQVVQLRPDEHHVATDGFACIKGLKQHRVYGSADRLHYPEKRTGSTWQRISWAQAESEIGQRVRHLRARHGPDSIAMYVGTAAGFSVLHPIFAQGFMMGLGSRSMYSSATQDCSNKFAVAREMYGFPFTQPFPDLLHTGCLIVVGANPVVSKWSFLQVPNPGRHLREIEERGGRVYFVDPRRTESARSAGEHVFIRPGTDVFFYLSFLREVLQRGTLARDRIARHMSGFDALWPLCAPWDPERTAEVTRIAPDRLRRMVADYCDADGAALYSSTGVNMGGRGALCFWLQECINAVTGNLDRRGGTLVGRGITDFAAFGKRTGVLLRRDRSRIGDFPSVNDAYPGGVLADEILTPGPGQVRALFVTGGNPLITLPGGERLRKSFEQLDLLVSLDLFRGETASLAHYVLPATSPLQRPDLPFLFPLLMGMQVRPYLQATRAVVPPDGEQRDEATIYLGLCRACGVGLFGSRIAQLCLEALRGARGLFGGKPAGQPALPQEVLLSLLLRVTGQGGFRDLLRHRHGRLRPPHDPGDFLGKRVVTEDGLVHLSPPPLLSQARGLEGEFLREKRDAGRLKLITRRAITTHNSWMHNLAEFVEGDRGQNYLYMHPEDARRAGLHEGALADVSSATATVRVSVKLLADLMPGTVALPHGWGHQHATGLQVAQRTRGVNANLLAADGPDRLERVSGMAHLTGIVVDVRPAAGPRDVTQWSGV